MEVSGQLHVLDALPQERAPPYPLYIVGWVSTRAGLDAVVRRKIPIPFSETNPGRPYHTPKINFKFPPTKFELVINEHQD